MSPPLAGEAIALFLERQSEARPWGLSAVRLSSVVRNIVMGVIPAAVSIKDSSATCRMDRFYVGIVLQAIPMIRVEIQPLMLPPPESSGFPLLLRSSKPRSC